MAHQDTRPIDDASCIQADVTQRWVTATSVIAWSTRTAGIAGEDLRTGIGNAVREASETSLELLSTMVVDRQIPAADATSCGTPAW
jgi:hypothetical protein